MQRIKTKLVDKPLWIKISRTNLIAHTIVIRREYVSLGIVSYRLIPMCNGLLDNFQLSNIIFRTNSCSCVGEFRPELETYTYDCTSFYVYLLSVNFLGEKKKTFASERKEPYTRIVLKKIKKKPGNLL